MSLEKKIVRREKRRTLRVRKKFKYSDLPRVSVFRSAKHIYGQIIDDQSKSTLASYSTLQIDSKITGNKKDIAHKVGLELAKKAIEKGLKEVAFDRGPFLYHGRIKAFADGMREGGIEI